MNILFEDNHIIVAVKEPGILSQADITGDLDMLTLLKSYLKEKYNKPGNVFVGLVHRLDKNVGGVMVFAKTSKAASRLSQSIKSKEFKKTYLAVVEGILDSASGSLKNYLLKSQDIKKTLVVNSLTKDAKLAELNYKVLQVKNNRSLVEVDLITGRSHQIRVQFANINNPIVGDSLYSKNKRDSNSAIALWAYKLEFMHPVKREKMEFKSVPILSEMWNDFDIL